MSMNGSACAEILVRELPGVRKAHFLHSTAPGRGEHESHEVVFHVAVGMQVNFGLWVFARRGPKVSFQLLKSLERATVPGDGAIKVDFQVNDLRGVSYSGLLPHRACPARLHASSWEVKQSM
jgi:hypothetical protein